MASLTELVRISPRSMFTRLVALLPLFPAVALFVFFAYLVFHARGLPDYDYWSIFPSMLADGRLHITPATLYALSNEHIVLVPKLVYLANFALTDGDNFGLALVVCAYALFVALVFTHVLTRHATSTIEAVMLGAVAAAAAYSSLAAHNFFIGMSGVAWFGANAAMVCAAAMLMRALRTNSRGWLAAAVVLSLVAGHTYSTGVVAMLALGLQARSLPGTRRLGAILLVAGFVFLLIVYRFQHVPAAHGERTFDLAKLLIFALKFLGGGLTRSPSLALLWGGAGLAAFLALGWSHLRQRSGDASISAFWIAICSYVLMNAGIAAIGRSGMGEGAALASRYASVPSLFWIGLLGLALSHYPRAAAVAAGPRIRGIVVLALLAVATSMTEGWSRVEQALRRTEGKPVASLAVWLGVHDDAYFRTNITPAMGQLYRALPDLRAIGHLPFDDRFDDCPRLGERLQAAAPDSATRIIGHVDVATPVRDGWFRVHGWALAPELDDPPLVRNEDLVAERACMALVDDRNRVIGLGIGGMARDDVARVYKREQAAFGWSGYARIERGAEESRVRAMLRDPAGNAWLEVPSSLKIPAQARGGKSGQ